MPGQEPGGGPAAWARKRDADRTTHEPRREHRRRTRCRPWVPTAGRRPSRLPVRVWSRDRPPQQRAHFFLNVDDDLGFAQLFGKARVVLLKFLNFLLRRIALGFGAALLRSQRVANAGGALAPPGAEKRRVQAFAAQQRSDATGAFRLVGFGQDALFVLGGEAAALGLGDDLGVGVGAGFGAVFAASGTPVALASLGLPTCHRQQSRWRRRGNLMVVHV